MAMNEEEEKSEKCECWWICGVIELDSTNNEESEGQGKWEKS